jgi:LmbE family N-acetylglucosaminyl deacetylase
VNAALDLLVLSPHLDDGVLSCGARLAATAAAGGRARVVTVFAGDEPAQPAGLLATELRARWHLPPGEVVAARRAEDREACRRLGVEAEPWPLVEALYRTRADGAPLYPTLGALFGEVAADDAGTIAEVAARVAALPPAALLLAPLGVGGHVDHRAVRRAAEASGREIAYYEEFPYSEWKWFAVARALGGRRGWRPEALPVDAGLARRRLEAICAYVSQVPALFRSEARLARQLRRAARRAGGERIWRRSPPGAPAR